MNNNDKQPTQRKEDSFTVRSSGPPMVAFDFRSYRSYYFETWDVNAAAEGLEDSLRHEVVEAQRRYFANPDDKTACEEYQRLLHLFANLVLRNRLPPSSE